MKDYKKLIKQIKKNPLFNIISTTRKNTIKVVHIESGELYSVHPGDNAVFPLTKWVKKFEQ